MDLAPRGSASFFVGNHGSTQGIGDWIRNFAKILDAHGWNLTVASGLGHADLVVVLDEFSGPFFAESFVDWSRRRPSSSTLLVALSEFMSVGKDGHLVLNHFEHWSRELRFTRGMMKHPVRGVREPLGRSRYLRRRAVGLERVIKSAAIDAYIVGHHAIGMQLLDLHARWGLPAPVILEVDHPALRAGIFETQTPDGLNRLFAEAEPALDFDDDFMPSTPMADSRFATPMAVQGFTTPFRRSLIRAMTRMGANFVTMSDAQNWRSKPSSYWGFDFVIPRTSGWPYTSPFRLLRAHQVGLIPIALESWWPEDESAWRDLCVQVADLPAALRMMQAPAQPALQEELKRLSTSLSDAFGAGTFMGWEALLRQASET